MRLLVSMLIGLMILALPIDVYAQEATDSADSDQVAERPDGFIPDPESRFFGLQVAWLNVQESVERVFANTEDKKLELEIKYAEKEAWMLARIESAINRDNPELVAKLEAQLVKMQEGYQKRLEMIDLRLEKIEERGERFEERKDEWAERMKMRHNRLQERRQRRLDESEIDEVEIRESTDSPQIMPAETPQVQVIDQVPLRDGRGN